MPEPKIILALAGSPRAGGNTDRLLDAFLAGASGRGLTVEKHYLSRLDIKPCRHCGACLSEGACVQKDDMAVIYRGLARAGGLVLASPVYFMSVTAQAKTVIDRCQALWAAKYRLGRPVHPDVRPGAFISAAGQEAPGTFDCSLKVVRAFFKTAQFRLTASLLAPGLDELRGDDPDARLLEEARGKGEAFLEAVARGGEGA